QGGFPLDDKVYQQLCEADWRAIGPELLAFAIWRVKLYRWQSGKRIGFAPGSTPEDVVQHVIEKTLRGESHGDPAKGPLVPWLKDQVKSVTDDWATSAPSRREVLAGERDEEDQEDRELAVQPAHHEKSLLTTERISALFQAVSNDRELEEVVEAIMSGCEPTLRHLSAELKVSRQEINNRLKRLRRRALRQEDNS